MYETYKTRPFFKTLILLTSAIEIPFAATYFGWPALVYILKSENYFSDLKACQISEAENSTSATIANTSALHAPLNTNNTTDGACKDRQDFIYASLFSTADITCFSLALLMGSIFDKYGTRVSRNLSNALLMTGSLTAWLLVTPGYQSFFRNEWLLFVTMACLGSSSVPLLITNNQIGFIIPKYYELVLTLNNGMFDTGDGLTVIPKLLHEKYGTKFGTWFMVYSIVQLLVFLRTNLLLPKDFIKKEDFEENPTSSSPSTDLGEAEKLKAAEAEAENSENSPAKGLEQITNMTVFSWFKKQELLSLLPYFTFLNLFLNFFHSNLNPWLVECSNNDPEYISSMTDWFHYLAPMALVYSQINGLIIKSAQNYYKKQGNLSETNVRRKSLRLIIMLIIVCAVTICGLMALMRQSVAISLSAFFLEIFIRTAFFSSIDIFMLSEFPLNCYGRLLGTIQIFWAISIPLNSVFINLAQKTRHLTFGGYPLVFAFYAVVVSAFGSYAVFIYGKTIKKHDGKIFK